LPLLDQLAESGFLKISRSPDFDHFKGIEALADARSMPLDCRNFASSFAAVTLKSCSIYLQQTFPRILQARYFTTGAIVGFAMDDAVSIVLNGVEARVPAFLLAKGSAACEIVEPRANLVALLNFESIADRGWPGERDRAQLIATQSAEYEALRAITGDVLTLASNSPEALLLPRMIENLEESILQAVDHAVHAALPVMESKRSNLAHYLSLVRKLEEFLHSNASKTIYSGELARQLGASVRTLHNAVVAIRGMSVQRYTRLRCLWNVRQRLVQGLPTETVRTVALANGFWHMGEFSRQYRDLFGETPQQTLLAARRHNGGLP
jgi:AraC-like DNA-binding protein